VPYDTHDRDDLKTIAVSAAIMSSNTQAMADA
jgi:hypothetical protein